jgi:hypothetical protein
LRECTCCFLESILVLLSRTQVKANDNAQNSEHDEQIPAG